MSKRKFTFEDWKAGIIREAYENNGIEGFDDKMLFGIGYLPQQLNEQGFITDDEHLKIERAQKEIFDKSVENAYKSFLNKFLERLENAYKPAELIKNRIKRLQSELDRASNHTLDQVYEGSWSKVGIGHKAYAMVNNPDGVGYTYLHNTIQTPAHNTRTTNHVFVRTISLRQIEALEKLLETKYFDNNDEKEKLNRDDIFKKVSGYKENGMKVDLIFKKIEEWLLDDLGFTQKELKERFNFSLKNADSFNRFVNKHISHHN